MIVEGIDASAERCSVESERVVVKAIAAAAGRDAGRAGHRGESRGTKEALALVAEPDTQPTSRSACVARFWMVRRYLP